MENNLSLKEKIYRTIHILCYERTDINSKLMTAWFGHYELGSYIAFDLSFREKIYRTIHILIQERGSIIFKLFSLWFGWYDGAMYYHYNLYDIFITRQIWMFKRLFMFPIAYYTSIILNTLQRLCGEFKARLSTWVNTINLDAEDAIHKTSQNDHKVPNICEVNNVFPMEIWELIANYGDLKTSVMLMINKTFFVTFSSKLYNTLHLTIVLSKLTKMKLNDENFLKYGPDVLNTPCDSYSIYKRNKISKSFDYEFLDTEIVPDQTLNDKLGEGLTEEQHEHPKSKFSIERDNIPTEVRRFSEINHIIKSIIHNPNSKMKCFIKEVLIDICILDGSIELVGKNTGALNLIRELMTAKNKDIIRASSSVNGRNKVIPVDDNFQRNRWSDPIELITKCDRSSKKAYTATRKPKILDIFPSKIYYKELLIVYMLSKNNYSSKLRRRLFYVKNREHLNKCNPVRYWEKQMKLKSTPIHNNLDLNSRQKMTFNAQLCVDIKGREFKTKADTVEFLQDLIETFINPNYIKTGDFNAKSSILITGPCDSKPQMTHEFTRRAIFGGDGLVNYDMFMILVNKAFHKNKE
ncbi:hypothetical protein BN7_5558 [Wickerhamomyces ciferrii]|uniref:Uncharacterized protein n=1 Tax=Wickerhamomyces ciferrii (strain ATCC 14091 / BCRC 22168 / CBS 111 / JCM 3599 / NBRC 0793 / NRRL Y-1031 F-60-10) TaxID=1206466 RepID=K0KS28_WICCF|nr:uncharacterized protein BN7_5558 [Wickerhamomyces ciferrii]CCH45971.1 hypothetical protein BN7_5558 [Wickerhamomyces ciferrii]